MPCYEPDTDRDYYSEYYKERLNKVTNILCGVVNLLRNTNEELSFKDILEKVEGLPVWVRDHDKADNQRRQLEEREEKRKQAKRKALEKLTLAEREILGLK